jgi:hypothetical protein
MTVREKLITSFGEKSRLCFANRNTFMALERVALMAENPSTHARAATATKITANILTVKCPEIRSLDTVVTDLLYRYCDDDIPPNRIMKWLHMIFGILYQRYLGESVRSEGPSFDGFIIK